MGISSLFDRWRQVFNAQEQLALLFLGSSLLIGTGIGLVDNADPDRFTDFAVIKGAVPAPEAKAPAGVIWPMELNSASAGELEKLPSIGPKTAARIVEYRRQHGDFAAVEELVRVRGIGTRTLEKLRPLLRLE